MAIKVTVSTRLFMCVVWSLRGWAGRLTAAHRLGGSGFRALISALTPMRGALAPKEKSERVEMILMYQYDHSSGQLLSSKIWSGNKAWPHVTAKSRK